MLVHFKSDKMFSQPIVWMTTLIMVVLHLGAVAVLFVFGRSAFFLAIILWREFSGSRWMGVNKDKIFAILMSFFNDAKICA